MPLFIAPFIQFWRLHALSLLVMAAPLIALVPTLASNSPASGYALTNYNVPFDFAGNPRQPGSTAAGAFNNVTKP